MSFVVSRQAPVAADPGQGAFHDPAFGQHDEAPNIAALHDLERPTTGAGDERAHLGSGVATIGDDALDEWKAPPCLSQQRFGTVAVLDIGRLHVDVQQQALRVDEDVTLAPKDLLPSVVP